MKLSYTLPRNHLNNLKGHLISKCPFGAFKSTKKPTKFLYGSLISFDSTTFKTLGQNSLQTFCWFFGRFEDTKRTFRN